MSSYCRMDNTYNAMSEMMMCSEQKKQPKTQSSKIPIITSDLFHGKVKP